MPVDAELRTLDIDIPSQPESLVKLSLLLAEDEINLQAVSALIETDMALAAAVLKAVNSSLYGLKGRVQSVQQAITYLGMREVAAITFEMGLRAAFPPAPELEPLWQRAAPRGLLMGRLAQRLGARRLGRAFGRAVRGVRQGGAVPPCARPLPLDAARGRRRRRAGRRSSTPASASATTRSAPRCARAGAWAPAAVASVRHHVAVQAHSELPRGTGRAGRSARCRCVAHALMDAPGAGSTRSSPAIAPQAELDADAGAARGAPGRRSSSTGRGQRPLTA